MTNSAPKSSVPDDSPARDAERAGERPGMIMGRPFGIPVYVSPSWFLIAGVITLLWAPVVESYVPGIGPLRYLVAFVFAVLLYLSVLVHELSHSVVARGFGLPVRQITLFPFGGVSEIEREPQTPGREFLVAFAGPLLSLVLAGAGYLLEDLMPAASTAWVLTRELWIANLLVGLFNLLPGLPLDGGRMLRAGVWKVTGRPVVATVVAGWIGRVVAVVVVLIPIAGAAAAGREPNWLGIVWVALIASFIWVGAGQAIRVARIRDRLPALHARRLARRAVPVTADVPLAEAIRRAGEAEAGAIVVVDHEGLPVALVNESAVLATPEHRRPWIQVGALARGIGPDLVLSADLGGQELLEAMRRAPATEYLLVEGGGAVYGVLSSADVDRAFAGV